MFSAQGYEVFEFDKLTRTAQEAADALGCQLGQIAKSVVFKADSGGTILVVTSGSNRVNEAKIKESQKLVLLKADADFVKNKTGFVIGGVPPWGHKSVPITLIDESLANYDFIYAAAGKNNAVFRLTFDDLVKKTQGKVIQVS
jgi:prolyl-tRNA editing enzyme YbaK/EbsC (Cys-tRNA(Pro) deacylase)